MVDIRPSFLSLTLKALRMGYAAGHTSLVAEYDAIVDRVKVAVEKRHAEEEDPDWVDEATGLKISNIEYQVACGQVAEDALQAHRKAYAVMIYHAWEKHVCTYMGWPTYGGKKSFKELKKDRWTIDPKGLVLLQHVANCIKHGSAKLYDFDNSMFGETIFLFESNGLLARESDDRRINRDGLWTNWEDALHLTAEHILRFFDIVERSSQIAPDIHS